MSSKISYTELEGFDICVIGIVISLGLLVEVVSSGLGKYCLRSNVILHSFYKCSNIKTKHRPKPGIYGQPSVTLQNLMIPCVKYNRRTFYSCILTAVKKGRCIKKW